MKTYYETCVTTFLKFLALLNQTFLSKYRKGKNLLRTTIMFILPSFEKYCFSKANNLYIFQLMSTSTNFSTNSETFIYKLNMEHQTK